MILTKTESDSLYLNTLFYANKAAFPGTRAIDKIYISKDNGLQWTWNGSTIDSEGRTGVYKALMTQTGTAAPTATVLLNSIGSIVWSRDGVGNYIGTLTGAFTDVVPMYRAITINGSDEIGYLSISKVSSDIVRAIIFNLITSTGEELEDINVPITIETYP